MARYLFGAGGDGEINSATTGLPYANTVANIYNARTGGSLVTDLQNTSGGAISQVTSDAYGQFAFFGPDAYTNTLWLDLGTGPRWAMRPADIASMVSAAVTTNMSATISQVRASDYTNRVFTTKAALPKNTNDPLEAGLADALDPLLIPRFASSSARNTAFPSPADGDRCYRTDNHQMERYDSAAAAWLPSEQGVWTAYTPTWTSTGTAPVLNNGSFAARYCQIGKMVFVAFLLTPGSTTTFGTGTYSFSLPVTARSATPLMHGAARYLQSGGTQWPGTALIGVTTTTFQIAFPTNTTTTTLTTMTNAAPATFANGDTLRASFFYEAA